MQRIIWIASLTVLMLITNGHVRADSITLNSGEVIEGQITSDTSTHIQIQLARYSGVVKTIAKTDIRPNSIRRGTTQPSVPTDATTVQATSLAQTTVVAAADDNRKPFAYTGNGFDFVIQLGYERKSKISIDPEIVGELAKSQVNISPATTAPVVDLLAAQMRPLGVAVYPVQLNANTRVLFLTSPILMSYYSASASLQRGDPQTAARVLSTINIDTSLLGGHCARLQIALAQVIQREQDMTRLEYQVNQSISKFRAAKEMMRSYEQVARQGSGFRNDNVRRMGKQAAISAKAAADAQHEQAIEMFNQAWTSLIEFSNKAFTDYGVIIKCYQEAEAMQLEAEAWYLLNHMVSGLQRFRQLLDVASKEQIAHETPELGDTTATIRNKKSEYERTLGVVQGIVLTATNLLSTDPELATRQFIKAYELDHSSYSAIVRLGYCQFLKQIKGLEKLANVGGQTDIGARKRALEKEFREQERKELLQMLAVIDQLPTNSPVMVASSKIGSTKGLAVTFGEGGIFGISVRVESITRSQRTASEAKGFWARLDEQLHGDPLGDEPIKFGDYGGKDVFMYASAIEAYRWLSSVDASILTGMRIDFHNQFNGKGGDSAGVTIATSGYSVLKQVGVRQNIAMTGSIRSDGTVKAVGGVPRKIDGAFRALGVDTVIVPKENRLDLLAVPADQLCQMVLITQDDITGYLKYATITKELTPEIANLKTSIVRTRLAQVLLQLGERKIASELLTTVRDNHPEIFNAERLLDLINRTSVTNSSSPVQVVSIETASNIVETLAPQVKLTTNEPVPTQTVGASQSPASTESSPPAPPWWKEHWILLTMGTLVILWFLFRSR